MHVVVKYLVTAALVVAVSEAAKRSERGGAVLAALPLVTVSTLIWLHVERQPVERIANHAWFTFWYVIPTLPMFLAFPWLLPRVGFWPSLAASAAITVAAFRLTVIAGRAVGVALL